MSGLGGAPKHPFATDGDFILIGDFHIPSRRSSAYKALIRICPYGRNPTLSIRNSRSSLERGRCAPPNRSAGLAVESLGRAAFEFPRLDVDPLVLDIAIKRDDLQQFQVFVADALEPVLGAAWHHDTLVDPELT